MSGYGKCLRDAMLWLGHQPDTLFMGQSVACPGTSMFGTLEDVPMEKRLELPVFEDTQMGMATGMALAGLVPICIFPRINFLLLAMNQLVLHLDKLPIYSHGGYNPKVIIRTAIASRQPLDPQAQHYGDYTDAIRRMLSTVNVIELEREEDIVPAYRWAYERKGSTMLVEFTQRFA